MNDASVVTMGNNFLKHQKMIYDTEGKQIYKFKEENHPEMATMMRELSLIGGAWMVILNQSQWDVRAKCVSLIGGAVVVNLI